MKDFQEYDLIGWSETVSFPKFKLKNLKCKIDTGAKTSALHAEEIEHMTFKGRKYVSFVFVTDDGRRKIIKAPLIEERSIKSSTGNLTIRPVVKTTIKLGRHEYEIEITLIDRNLMGFKMLLGREALKNRFVINPARSHLLK
jgi:hypothetical protein